MTDTIVQGLGLVVLPAHGSPLSAPVKRIACTAAGNLGVVLADGTSNDSNLIAMTPGQTIDLQAISLSTSATGTYIGWR